MSQRDITTELLGIQGIEVVLIKESEEAISISVETEAKGANCPCCGSKTKYIHDYRTQKIKDLRVRGKAVIIILRKRRYICKECGKRFLEKYSFLPRYHRMTRRVYESIIRSMRENYSMKSIAKEYNVSTNTVSRIFDIVEYGLYKLPKVLSLDEFKGNSGGEKYHLILTEPDKKRVLDILPSREQTHLIDYFKGFRNRDSVKFVVMDMWQPYRSVSKAFFPNAKIIVDKYHYVRQVYWALDRVRKRIQKLFIKEKRIYFKRSKRLLFAEYSKLSDENKQAVQIMLYQHEDLFNAWQLKEMFISFRKCKNSSEGRKLLREWILTAQNSELNEFKDCTTAYSNWFYEILNSLDYPYTNAFTEGSNNRIKVLKRNAFGFRNFSRFRNRILHCCGC